MQTFSNAATGDVVLTLAARIVENRAYLSEIDGKIGDGDHGMNMAKGFGMAAERLKGNEMLTVALRHAWHPADDRDRRLYGPTLRRHVH